MGVLSRRIVSRMGVTPQYDVDVTRKVPIGMADGVSLLANLYEPRGLEKTPTVLVRSTATLHVASTAATADFFVRLCDVDEAGVSRNVCDGLQRVRVDPGDSVQEVRVELWPTAYRFQPGHRIRVQVSSGAFPRWSRNLGGREPLGTGTAMQAADQAIHHSPTAPSAIALPVVPSTE